jgi:NADH:ubiquinone oxidoreductase subunit E
MVEIAICVGSSCHLKGSHDVIEAFTEEVKKRHLETRSS